MKYNDNGEIKEIKVKVLDTVPVGSIMDYDGDTIPSGWVKDEATDDYSTEEIYTGKHWIDGKKIYRKTVVYSKAANVAEDSIPHGISNLETPIKYECMSRVASSWRPVPGFYSSNVGTYNQCIYVVDSTGFSYTGSTWYAARAVDLYITLYYTKTTD